ncbi:MAG: hypothetical protein JXA78_16035 [Anaerolineales bacterium]|nr:hypothetical protein [Anaerolineales bacterium]
MREKKISFPACIILLMLIMALPSLQAPIFAQDIPWEPIQGPTISGGTISQIMIDSLDSDHLFAFQRQHGSSCVLFESQDAAVSWKAVYIFQRWISNSAIDPSNPSIIYAGASGSILRSMDGGRGWEEIADWGPVIASPAANTLYSIENMKYSDDCPTGNLNFAVSHDRGDTWEKHPLGCYYVHQIATTPSYPGRVYIRAESDSYSRLLRSTDGGDTWSTIPLTGAWFTHGFVPIAIDPIQPEKLYTSSGAGIIVSTNGGLTWRSVLDTPIRGPFRFSFSNGVIYAGVDPVTYGELPAIYHSEDGGETWKALPWIAPDRLNDLQASDCRPGWLLAALNGFGIYQSQDGGKSWQAANGGLQSATIVEKMASSQSASGVIYAISNWPRYALFKTNNSGQTWSEPVLEADFYTVVVHPFNPDVIWVVDREGIQESLDGGESWRRVSSLLVNNLAVSPNAPERPCASGFSAKGSYLLCRVNKCRDCEYYWNQSPIVGIQNAGKLAIRPTQGSWMMLRGRTDNNTLDVSIFRSQDGGRSWEEVLQGPKDYSLLNLVVSGGQPARVLAIFFQYHPDNLLVYQSLDGGTSWQDITSQLAEAGGEMWTAWTYKAPVVFDDAGATYFGTRDIVLRQARSGQPWEVVWDYNDFIQDMLVLPGSQSSLLVSSSQSLWMSQLPVIRSIWMPVIFRD